MGLKKPVKTGSDLPTINELVGVDVAPVETDGYIVLDTVPGQACVMESNTPISIKAELGKFGDATAADVASGKTFTSEKGLKVVGSHVCPTVADLTADADATAGDIAQGKTAYVKGDLVTGSLVPGFTLVETLVAEGTAQTYQLDMSKNYLIISYFSFNSKFACDMFDVSNGAVNIIFTSNTDGLGRNNTSVSSEGLLKSGFGSQGTGDRRVKVRIYQEV